VSHESNKEKKNRRDGGGGGCKCLALLLFSPTLTDSSVA